MLHVNAGDSVFTDKKTHYISFLILSGHFCINTTGCVTGNLKLDTDR